MDIAKRHDWNVTYQKALEIQNGLRERLILEDRYIPEPIKTVAGADISYSRTSNTFFASVVLLDFQTMEIIERTSSEGEAGFPYIPGMLTFREGPVLIEAFRELALPPDIIIFDGQGIAHPRGFGLASHMGLVLDTPSIGCGKKKLVGSYEDPGTEPWDYSRLVHNDETVGVALRTKKKVNPVFISQGHRIGLNKAMEVVRSCCRGYRLPEPTRKAHLTARENRLNAGD